MCRTIGWETQIETDDDDNYGYVWWIVDDEDNYAAIGRAAMRPFGPLMLPARFRFVHEAGQGYRHYIEVIFFGMSNMKVSEHFLDGHGRLALPFGVAESALIDQGATLSLWSESLWFLSIFLTAPGVRWEALDEVTALLVVPFNGQRQRYVVRFDPPSGWSIG